MKHLLITGANGQLGKETTNQAKKEYKVTALGKEELDITNLKHVKKTIEELKPDVIIHAAAYTEVVQSEVETTKAFNVNGLGASYVAHAASKIGAKHVYISTDYVFDGKKMGPYQIDDEPNPLNVYGKSKLFGEKLVRESTENYAIVRTSWLYGHEGKNFVKTMLRLAKKRKPINVVSDQIGSPTYTKDLASILLQLIEKQNGIYHVSNSGACSWYEFARKIFEFAGYNPDLVQPTTSVDFGSISRPSYSVLGNDQLVKIGLERPRHWEEALKEFIREELKN